MALVIEPPNPSDRAAWEQLWGGYCAFYQVPHTPEKSETVWGWLMDPAHPVKGFVARDGQGGVIGITHYRPYPRPIAGGTGCFLDDLFVSPDARGGRIADALIARVVDEARAKGWAVVRWITAQNNYRARSVYDRVGTQTHWVTYEIKP